LRQNDWVDLTILDAGGQRLVPLSGLLFVSLSSLMDDPQKKHGLGIFFLEIFLEILDMICLTGLSSGGEIDPLGRDSGFFPAPASP
jgi:hypothetical protein